MNLSELRNAVRGQMDLDEDDLSNLLLGGYLNEAVQQTAAMESRWPFLGTAWNVASTASSGAVALPANFGAVAALVGPDGRTLPYVGHEFAEQNFTGDVGDPLVYSVWGSSLYLWPIPEAVENYVLRGWRVPGPLVAASDQPDLDVRLHSPLVHYACSRAYAQQEDELLARENLQTWSAAVNAVRNVIMRPRFQGALIGNSQPSAKRRRRGF